MRFYEFEAKQVLSKQGVRLPKGGVARTPDEARKLAEDVGGPVVLKSQVLSGGRMKAGGVKFADTPAEAAEHAEFILKLPIKDQLPVAVSVEAKAAVAKEYYLGVTFDGVAKLPVMILSDMGGIDIEEVAETHPEHVAKMHFSTLLPFTEFRAKELVASLGIKGIGADGDHGRGDAPRAHVPRVRPDAGGDQPARPARGRLVRRARLPPRPRGRGARAAPGAARRVGHRAGRSAPGTTADGLREARRAGRLRRTTAASRDASSSSTATSGS